MQLDYVFLFLLNTRDDNWEFKEDSVMKNALYLFTRKSKDSTPNIFKLIS